MQHPISWLGLSAAVLGLALASPQRAAACSCLATPIHKSDPANGERDVARNHAIFLEGVFLPNSVRLEDEHGQPVEFDLNAGPWPGCEGTSADLVPKEPLAPNTRYVLHVEPRYPEALDPSEPSSFEFTTGTDMLPDPDLDPPTRAAAAVVFDAPEAMCGSRNTVFTCLDVDETSDLELIMRRGDDVLLRTTTLVHDDGMYALQEVPDCVELRRRAPTGKRSAPVTICADDLAARRWVESDSVQSVVQCRDGVIGAPDSKSDQAPRRAGSNGPEAADDGEHRSSGCAATSRDGASGAGFLALLALAALVGRRLRPTRR